MIIEKRTGRGVKEKKSKSTYTTWNKLAGYHRTFARDDTWVSNNAREHAEAFFCDRSLHVGSQAGGGKFLGI
jgi:hypothetical protein